MSLWQDAVTPFTLVTSRVTTICQGPLNLEAVRRSLRTTWTEAQQDGQSLHSKMRSRISRAFGYFYWIPENEFSIDKHVQLVECEPPENDSNFDNILTRIWNRPFPDQISPWKMFLFPLSPNHPRFADQPHYVMLLRIHHSSADGFSTIRMVAKGLFDANSTTYRPCTQANTIVPSFFISLFYTPLHLARILFCSDANRLHGPKQSGKRMLRFSKPLELTRVARVGKMVGATVNDVLVSCVTAACKQYFENQADKNGNEVRVHVQVPISLHADTDTVQFKNNTPAMFLALPVARKVNVLDCLKLVHEELVQPEEVVLPSLLLFDSKTSYKSPATVTTQIVSRMSGSTLVITNISMYQSWCVTTLGHIVKDCIMAPMHNLDLAVGISVTTYNGKIKLGMSADELVVDNVKTLKRFLATCIQEFDILEQDAKIK